MKLFNNKSLLRDRRLTIILVLACVLLVADLNYSFQRKSGHPQEPLKDNVQLCVNDKRRLSTEKCSSVRAGESALKIPVELSPLFFQPIPINSAEKEMLMTVKGIGPVLADIIIEYRLRNGPFIDKNDLKALSGIGNKRANYLATVLTFDEPQ